MSTSVVLLAYQEAENLKVLLPQIHAVMQEMRIPYEILVIDSARPLDDTQQVCHQQNARYIPQEEPYYAGAFRTGIRHAALQRIQVLDADGSHNPRDIPHIHALFDQGYDLVIGSRYTQGGVSNDSRSSYLMSQLLNVTMRLCIGVRAKDISTSYRLYDAAQLKAVTLTRNNYDVLQEVILRMKMNKKDLRIGEVPIAFEKRMFGQSKRQLLKFIAGYFVTVLMLLRVRIASTFVRRGRADA
ncbi:MAG: glycosyltransferase [Eubacteriales bacterium]|nr:glycosyltransferase [Eubacteriales bacterium]